MNYDIIWATKPKLLVAIKALYQLPEEVRQAYRLKWGWSLISEDCAIPDVDGALTKTRGKCVMTSRLGAALIRPTVAKDGKLVIAPELELTMEDGWAGGRFKPSVWQRPEIVAQAQKDQQTAEEAEAQRSQTDLERQERNRIKQFNKLKLFKNYKLASAVIMGAKEPEKLSDDILDTLSIFSIAVKKDIPTVNEYLSFYEEEISEEQEPPFVTSDDPQEYLDFIAKAKGAFISNESRTVKR